MYVVIAQRAVVRGEGKFIGYYTSGPFQKREVAEQASLTALANPECLLALVMSRDAVAAKIESCNSAGDFSERAVYQKALELFRNL